MLRRGSRIGVVVWRAMYSVAATLYMATWGLYFSFTRRYIGVELGGGLQAVILITGLEWGFTLFAAVMGRLTGRVGERNLILLGAAGCIPFLAAPGVRDPITLAVILSFYSLTWAISWPSVLSTVLGDSSVSPGRAYSYFTIGTGLGYSIGSACMGPIYGIAGPEGVFTTMVVTHLATYSMLIAFFPGSADIKATARGGRVINVDSVLSKLAPVLIAVSLTVFSRELLYSVAPSKLSMELENLVGSSSRLTEYTLFGLVYGGFTAILSIPARIIAGKLTDRHNPLVLFALVTTAYLIDYWLFVKSWGWVSILIWQLPLYPFLDTAINTYIAKQVPKDVMTSGFGLVIAFDALGGLMLLPLLVNPHLSMDFLGYVLTAAATISVALVLKKMRGCGWSSPPAFKDMDASCN
ncbi:MAG: MFS transporter [Zestosphaera sp.]